MNNSQFFIGKLWKLDGNANATSSSFLGTTTATDVVLKRNSIEGFRLAAGGAILATGNTLSGVTPTSGAGSRMMWIPAKAAFRAGQVSGTQWDDANVGLYSYVMGLNSIASGGSSIALGPSNNVSGLVSGAFGSSNVISGTGSIAAGSSNTVTQGSSFIYGSGNNIDNGFSVILGISNTTTNNSLGGIKCLGSGNSISGSDAICIGDNNIISGGVANPVTIGYNLFSTGANSFALGNYAKTNGKTGAFVIGDGSTTGSLTYVLSDVNNQFKTRFNGGYKFNLTDSSTAMNIAPTTGEVTISNLASTSTIDSSVRADTNGKLVAKPSQTRFVQTNFNAVSASTTSPTTIVGAGTGSLTLPPLVVGDLIRVTSKGVIIPSLSTSLSVNYTTYMNAAIVAGVAVVLPVYSGTLTYTYEMNITILSSTTANVYGTLIITDTYTIPTNYYNQCYNIIISPVTITTGSSNVIDLKSIWSATDGTAATRNAITILELIRV